MTKLYQQALIETIRGVRQNVSLEPSYLLVDGLRIPNPDIFGIIDNMPIGTTSEPPYFIDGIIRLGFFTLGD